MRINIDFPLYESVTKGKFTEFGYMPNYVKHFGPEKTLQISISLVDAVRDIDERFFVTDTFNDAFTKAHTKIKITDVNIVRTALEKSRIFFFKSIFVTHNFVNYSGKTYCQFFVCSAKNVAGYLIVDMDNIILSDDGKLIISAHGFIDVSNNSNINEHDYILSVFYEHILLNIFMQECEIETKVVERDKKFRHNGVKIYNDTKHSITFLDCRWFTELIRNTPFSVTGHFRFQRCGEGLQKKKLIWIDPYQKHGYHRKPTKQIAD